MKTLGQFLEEAKATYCGRCGTRHVPPSKGGTCPALKEGKIPTADEPTEHDKMMAQKVRDLLAKEKKPKKMVEAVEVNHDRYRSSHGKKASGPGAWMFTHKRSGEAKGDDTFTAPATARSFTDAAKHAKAWAKSKGHRTVYVMEETELTEMDKERGSRRDYDTQRGMDKTAKPMTVKKFAAAALKTLNKEETEIEDAGTPHEFRKQKIIHKGEHVATIHTYRGRAGGWVSSAHTPDGKSASKKYGIDLMDTKKQMISKIKNYHKGN